jgi:hypothetical protein
MKHGVRFVVTELGPDADPFMLHLYAALAEKEGFASRQPSFSLSRSGRFRIAAA